VFVNIEKVKHLLKEMDMHNVDKQCSIWRRQIMRDNFGVALDAVALKTQIPIPFFKQKGQIQKLKECSKSILKKCEIEYS
jgi:hypothetical protein